MKLQRIAIENFIGARSVRLELDTAITMICGKNGAGKSSVADAVKLALTADLGRVSLKKDAAQLITTNHGAASVEVTDVDGDVYGVTISSTGKIADTMKGRDTDPVLPYVLDAQRLASLSPTDRRAFLFGLTGAKMDGAAVAEKLKARGCDMAKAARVAPLLRSGFPAAAEDAKAQTTAAKGAWRAVTGETYGAVKAADWIAPSVAFNPISLDAALQALAAVDQGIATAQSTVGAQEQAERQTAEARAKLAGRSDTAGLLQRRRDKLAADEAGLKAAQDALDNATAKAGQGERVGLVHDLARSLNAVLELSDIDRDSVVGLDAEQALSAYVDVHGSVLHGEQGDPAARASLPNLTDARDLMASAVRNSMRDVKASEDAAAEVKLLQEQIKAAEAAGPATTVLSIARQQLATAQAARKTAAAAVDTLRAQKAAADGAAKKTADALKHHADVEAWGKIGAALAPDGIPGEILAHALGPINERLAQSAADAQWPVVVIAPDMGITYGGRVYSLVSESEQYRADAMLAEAVAHISTWQLLVLDRFDVLDLQGRADLIAWLDCLAENGELSSALLFGTLKALPTSLPATFAARWIKDGVCLEPAMAAQELAEAA